MKKDIVLKKKKVLEKNLSKPYKQNSISLSEGSFFDVFLGGACNPTTWRADEAIPFFKKAKIRYYNPQVSVWTEDLIQKERVAKDHAKIHLFVFDPTKSRGLASLIETAYLISRNKHVVLVRPDYLHPNKIIINGEKLSKQEWEDIQNGLRFLDNIMPDKKNIFANLLPALIHIENCIRSINVNENSVKVSKLSYSEYLHKAIRMNYQPCSGCNCKGFPWSVMEKSYEFKINGLESPCCCRDRRSVFCSKRAKFDYYLGGERNAIEPRLQSGRHDYIYPKLNYVKPLHVVEVQKLCNKLLYLFTPASFSIASMIEAAFVMGQGRNVSICVQMFPADWSTISYSKERSKSEDNPECEQSFRQSAIDFSKKELFHDSGTGSFDSVIESVGCVQNKDLHRISPSSKLTETSCMSSTAVADHNRARAYLISVANEMNCKLYKSPLDLIIERQ